MDHDEMMSQGTDFKKSYCVECDIYYEGSECPRCNPVHIYYVERMVQSGPDDYELEECGCKNELCVDGFPTLKEARDHAREMGEEYVVRDENGKEFWLE